MGPDRAEEPLLFLKPSTAVIGPNDPITLLPVSRRIDFEGELVVVIGRLAKDIKAEDAYRVILGYTCGNDVTLRTLQRSDDQWARAKGFDGSAPIGPWIETDLDPNDAVVEARLNGEIRQRKGTVDMVFGVATLIVHHLVHDALARRHDHDRHPQRGSVARPGDVVEVEVEGVGTLANTVR